MVDQKEKIAKLQAALAIAVWHDRKDLPLDPFCILCGVGHNWAMKHGHQKYCALFDYMPKLNRKDESSV